MRTAAYLNGQRPLRRGFPPTLVYEGADCVGKSTLLRGYHRDRAARGLRDVPSVDRLYASCAVYARLRDAAAVDGYLQELRTRERALAATGDFLYVYLYVPDEELRLRRGVTQHPTHWPVGREVEFFECWLRGSPLPVLALDGTGSEPEVLRALRAEVEQ